MHCTGPHSLHICHLPERQFAAIQVASRLFILWGVVDLVPATRSSHLVLLRLPLGGGAAAGGSGALQLSLVTLLTAWCCSEVIRYSFFAFKVSIVGPGSSLSRLVSLGLVGRRGLTAAFSTLDSDGSLRAYADCGSGLYHVRCSDGRLACTWPLPCPCRSWACSRMCCFTVQTMTAG